MESNKCKDKSRTSTPISSNEMSDSLTSFSTNDIIFNLPGLTNLGNTCYINATLQCLLTIQPLVEWLLSKPHLKTSGPVYKPDGPLLTPILSDLVIAIFGGNYISELKRFRTVIGDLVKDFKEPREQDAQEFLLFLLNRLHDENLVFGDPQTSEISKIFEGTLRTQLICSQCTLEKSSSKCIFSRNKDSKTHKGNTEVFLSLSLPIPVQEDQLKSATDTVDSNACDLNVVFNEIVDSNMNVCYRRLLKLHPSTDMQSIYNQIFSLPHITINPVSYFKYQKKFSTLNSHKNIKESSLDDDISATQDPFLLVQVKSTGFGDWFLESSGRALDLTDGLNVEDDFRTGSAGQSPNVKLSLLTGDALFIVRLNSKSITDEPPSTTYTSDSEFPPLPSTNTGNISATSMTVDESRTFAIAGQQMIESSTSNNADNSMQLLLVYVKELENRNTTDIYADDFNSTQASNFRRFSPPISMNVPTDIRFDDLRSQVLNSFKGYCDLQYYELLAGDAKENVRFWIVDAAPGEPREIDSQQEFPLLHSTIEVSSILLPQWLTKEGKGSPRLLRLLVVWPSTFRLCNPNIHVELDASLAEVVSSGAVGESDRTSSLKSSKSKNSKDDTFTEQNSSTGLTIMKCLEEFKKSTNVSKIDNFTCPKCKKSQESVLLTTKIEKAPNYLLLHLNRFVHVPPSLGGANGLMKINSLVDYHINNLNLSFMMDAPAKARNNRKNKDVSSSDQSEPIYELVAVCSHKGSIETGHITAYCRNIFTQQWWHYNDLKVQKVSSDQVVQPGAYLLFYKRKNSNDPAALQRMGKEVVRIRSQGKSKKFSETTGTAENAKVPHKCTSDMLSNWLFFKRPRL
ncbi:unnamed protein product [Hymenolepis diminuta]|uniref:ubiquitinyl hydrolase 1 n=1 Tax=Hymenolepis diminuta TaxID=6216 RepID=A0A564YN49_HYMDI|nr:unnamed protein product [Hymenolepis diminuta]